jgi:HlyD family secretion protein
VVQNVTSFQVRIILADQASLVDQGSLADQGSSKLISGMNFTAGFQVGRHPNALLIPTPAIVSQEQGTGVFVLGPNSQPQFQPIRVGATVGSHSEVLSGLKEGERIFITFPGRRAPNDKPVRSNSPFQQPQGGAGRIR